MLNTRSLNTSTLSFGARLQRCSKAFVQGLSCFLDRQLSRQVSRLIIATAVMSLLSACINTSTIDVVTQEPAEVEDRAVVDGEALPLPEENSLKTEPLGNGQGMSPVASRLLASAISSKAVGDFDSAAGNLERALRIEPENAVLWSQLADIRYSQSAYQQAVQLAAKSNTLAAGDQSLRRQNWVLMANAYAASGDEAAAQRYRDKLQTTQ